MDSITEAASRFCDLFEWAENNYALPRHSVYYLDAKCYLDRHNVGLTTFPTYDSTSQIRSGKQLITVHTIRVDERSNEWTVTIDDGRANYHTIDIVCGYEPCSSAIVLWIMIKAGLVSCVPDALFSLKHYTLDKDIEHALSFDDTAWARCEEEHLINLLNVCAPYISQRTIDLFFDYAERHELHSLMAQVLSHRTGGTKIEDL